MFSLLQAGVHQPARIGHLQVRRGGGFLAHLQFFLFQNPFIGTVYWCSILPDFPDRPTAFVFALPPEDDELLNK